jgi:hypothetical protein
MRGWAVLGLVICLAPVLMWWSSTLAGPRAATGTAPPSPETHSSSTPNDITPTSILTPVGRISDDEIETLWHYDESSNR